MSNRLYKRFVLACATLAMTLACNQEKLASTPNPGQQIDVFSQLPASQSDILWIIDDSGSMAREQDQLAESFPKFFAHLQDSQVDYRIAVTTTDIFAQAGNLVGTPQVIVGNSQDATVADTPNPEAAFSTNVHVGTSGSPRDEALEAALMALDQLQTQAGAAEDAGAAPLFLRPQAALFLIFVGDGIDYSPDYDLSGVQYYWREYLQAKGIGNDGLVQVAAIAGDLPNGCTPSCAPDGGTDGGTEGLNDGGAHDFAGGVSGAAAAPGVRYYELCELAGGVFGSICDCSFDTTLDTLGLQALGLTHKFRLSRPADPASLVVVVDYPCNTPDPVDDLYCTQLGSTCPSGYGAACTASCSDLDLACQVPQLAPDGGGAGGDGLDGWTYDPGDNSIIFSGQTIPSAGAQVTVSYDVAGVGT